MYQYGPFDILHTAKEGAHISVMPFATRALTDMKYQKDACWSGHSTKFQCQFEP
jgi:hypothetical protein